MSAVQFTGVMTAMITPFNNGAFSPEDMAAIAERQIADGVNGLAVVGTTGEASTLNFEEQIHAIRCVVETAAGRVPVIAGAGSNSTAEALHLTRLAEETGVDGFLHVAPYYNKPTQEGLFRHFSAIAEATEKPIVLYSIPSRCGIEIGVDTVARLRSRYPHVNHIKEAGGSCARVDQLVSELGDSVTVLCGDDGLTLPFMSLGAKGVISVASNLVTSELAEMVGAALRNDFVAALPMHRRLTALFQDIFIESNPVPIKAAMKRAGLIQSEEVRLPLAPLSDEGREKLWRTLENLEHASATR